MNQNAEFNLGFQPMPKKKSRSNPIAGGATDMREAADYYITPEHATKSLLMREDFRGTIWEPACGNGAISKLLPGFEDGQVYSSDLFDRGFGEAGVNFLEAKRPAINHIVTNPPYSLATRFVRHALTQCNGKIAFLLKLNFLESQGRKELFETTPLRSVYVFSRRISFDTGKKAGKGRGLLAFAWFVWEKGYIGKPQIEWI